MNVLCVTPNVAVDRTLRVPAFRDGGVWRAADVLIACGGKGINVGRALLRLKARPVRTVSAVGSGDCFLAGLLAGRKDDRYGEAPVSGLRLAVACGVANAQDIAVAPPTLGTLGTRLAAIIVRSLGN